MGGISVSSAAMRLEIERMGLEVGRRGSAMGHYQR
jgi:hypothetical protein